MRPNSIPPAISEMASGRTIMTSMLADPDVQRASLSRTMRMASPIKLHDLTQLAAAGAAAARRDELDEFGPDPSACGGLGDEKIGVAAGPDVGHGIAVHVIGDAIDHSDTDDAAVRGALRILRLAGRPHGFRSCQNCFAEVLKICLIPSQVLSAAGRPRAAEMI